MARLGLIGVAALLALGCDDPDVEAKALDILAHGIVQASVACEGVSSCSGYGASMPTRLEATLFLDGSSHVFVSLQGWIASSFNERGEPVDARGAVDDAGFITALVGSGDGVIGFDGSKCGTTDPTIKTFDLGTDCTGFNLEAFGVTP